MTQTTAGRITEIIREHLKFYAGSGEWAAAVEAGQEIAAEIDTLTRERDEARAEADRLRPAAEAWEAQENSASIFMRYLRGHAPYEDTITAEGNAKAARARAAKGTP